MDSPERDFPLLVTAIVRRFLAQNDHPAPGEAELLALAGRLRDIVTERGLPRALGPEEPGEPGGLPEPECAPLAARVAGSAASPLVAEAARQLVKACFQPEFRICRDSYREPGRDGLCRRQQVERVRSRISGAHCIDCPHWVALEAPAHADLLGQSWIGDRRDWEQHSALFLPEDFRALRRWLHAAARR
ncbi:MAG: hypothetical protein HZC55_28040 [Verrucomicrobia bacterium]|nr:hypothetical protein [Verrucomicrobiota bacterium]